VIKIEETAETFIIYLNGNINPNSNLYINGIKVNYNIKTTNSLRGISLYDDDDFLEFSILGEDKAFKINTNREIKGNLIDNLKRTYSYKLIEKKDEVGVWIVLKETNEENESSEDFKRSKFDIFFEILYSSIDYEIWEDTQINYTKKDKRIKVLKTNQDENKICLEREPVGKIIYPPKSTYILYMQLQAIRTLIYKPDLEHRNLLRLFEPLNETSWEKPSNEFDLNNINWFFLTDFDLEGTDEQRDFVLKALNSPDFAILEGPPGSGKTTTIAELIYQLIKQNKKVLLSSSTHVAVDNVLEKLEEKFKNLGGVMENGIVPLRIGREESISDDIVKYQIENRKEKILKIFEQESWFIQANPNEKKKYLEDAVINSSNLVCGTTIGILQYPNFKYNKGIGYIIPEFDCLIVDEASKTTFQEFLVPAIYAKKWIIVGDVRQLSPYTDTLQIRVNLDSLLNDQAQKRALVVFLKLLFSRKDVNINNRWLEPPKFIYVDKAMVIKHIKEIIPEKIKIYNQRYKNSKFYNLENYTYAIISNEFKENSKKDNIENISYETETINYFDDELDDESDDDLDNKFSEFEEEDDSDDQYFKFFDEDHLAKKYPSLINIDIIFVEEEIFKKNRDLFPYTHILIYPDSKDNDIHDYRHFYWYLSQGKGKYAYSIDRNKGLEFPWEIKEEVLNSIYKDWADELAWRMKRIAEIELSNENITGGSSKNFYFANLYALMPVNKHKEIMSNIRKIGEVALTSVINSLIKGVTEDWKSKEIKTAISHGLTDYVKDPRYIKLSYQHRMHKDISSIPRELFYSGEALIDDGLVINGYRDWYYNRYPGRAIWIDINNSQVYKNTNFKEAKAILAELQLFIKWAKNQNEKYSIMILSFYEAQRKRIRDLLRESYPDNRRRETTFIIDGLVIKNYTVDKAQGREADIVFISMVQNKRVGFMDSPNRLNVALTRARFQLVIFGDYKYFNEQKNSPEIREITKKIKKFEVKNDSDRSK
jgi:superfamily I DNA and/or RNA helicase